MTLPELPELHLADWRPTKDTLHLYYAWQQDARTEPNLQLNNVAGFGDHRTAHRQISRRRAAARAAGPRR